MEDRQILKVHDADLERHVRMIADEFRIGFQTVDGLDRPAVTIFGSARVSQDHPTFQAARETAARFAREGFAVITGGGPGVMEAANLGAREASGLSVGFNIDLPYEQAPNPYLDISLTFRHFYARKTMFVKAAEGFVVFPGGFGTLDELFESLTLIQTEKIEHFPVVLFGREHWRTLIGWVDERLLGEGLIAPNDLDLLSVTDDPTEAVALVVDCYRRTCSHLHEDPRERT